MGKARAGGHHYSLGGERVSAVEDDLFLVCIMKPFMYHATYLRNADLYRKIIVPTCACGGFESAYHFFFVCPRLAHFRR